MRTSSVHTGNRRSRRHRVLLAAVSVTLLALAAAGCGGGTSSAGASNSTAPGGTSATTPAATDSGGPATPDNPAPSATSAPPGSPTAPGTSTAGTSAPPAPPASTARSAGTRCTVTDLRMRLGRGDPGAGNIYYPLTFTNISGHPCTLDGFPGVSLLRGDGSVIGRPADRQGPGGTAVELAPGRTVEADLHTLNRGVREGSCWRQPTLVMVYPPGSTDAMTLATSQPTVCGDTFDVGAVH